jgi:hypothetical protein
VSLTLDTIGQPPLINIQTSFSNDTQWPNHFENGFTIPNNNLQPNVNPTVMLWQVTGNNPPTRSLVATYTGSVAANSIHNITSAVMAAGNGCRFVVTSLITDSSGSVFELPHSAYESPLYQFPNPQGTIVFETEPIFFPPTGSTQYFTVYDENTPYGIMSASYAFSFPYPFQTLGQIAFNPAYLPGTVSPYS